MIRAILCIAIVLFSINIVIADQMNRTCTDDCREIQSFQPMIIVRQTGRN